ncbi:bilirubin reductase, long form [Acetivibrio ethanolgignens]|uniref:NADH oxidase n=1 Tax=Acetivibrio ethanolgignens TaxID=290052 RepID=A0A0V8QI50_9FIRM|nr:bilirubin reductase, long form [Acetivibrio ethanolgignens]KSV60228.1 NADH oxidase [Acetivibrio ethanolgignens]
MKILEPIKVGKTTFKNRIMFPPLTTGYEERDGSIGEQSLNFYSRLAEGGVGYIVIGDVAPLNTVSPTPKLFKEEQVESFKKLSDACHKYDCKLGLQLFHPEYDVAALAALFAKGAMQEARVKLHHDMQHFVNEVTEEQLDVILEKMKACAALAVKAGVDAIEVHGDRLVGSLCSSILNKRTDSYGGSFENRTKFALKLVRALREAAPDIVIDYKLPVITPMKEGGLRGKGGLIPEEALKLAQLLEEAGVDTLHVAQANHTGNMADTIPPMGVQDYGFTVEYAKMVKDKVSIPVSCVGRIVTPQAAEAVVAGGLADMVGLGRSLLADPDFVKKCEENKPQCVRTCIMCNKGCTDSIQNRTFLSCVLNAENGYEYKRMIKKAEQVKKIAVIGAGPAGLEAARVAAERGHKVTVYDKAYHIGGQLRIASVPPRKEEMLRFVRYYEAVFAELTVDFKLGGTPSIEELNAYDEVIVATGAQNAMPPIPGADGAQVVSAWDVLDRKEIVFGKVAVIGGGLVGAETAEYLAHQGAEVTVIEMLDAIAKEESNTILPTMLEDFKEYGVVLSPNTKVDSIEAGIVNCTRTAKDGENEITEAVQIPADFVVMAVGAKKVRPELSGITVPVHYIGDCAEDAKGTIEYAVKSGYDVACEL